MIVQVVIRKPMLGRYILSMNRSRDTLIGGILMMMRQDFDVLEAVYEYVKDVLR